MKNKEIKKIATHYFKGMEAVGGHLYFDDKAMVFKSHALNIQTGETTIEYSSIDRVGKRNTAFIVPNGIFVFTKDGIEHKFVVNKKSRVLAFIESKLTK